MPNDMHSGFECSARRCNPISVNKMPKCGYQCWRQKESCGKRMTRQSKQEMYLSKTFYLASKFFSYINVNVKCTNFDNHHTYYTIENCTT